MALGGTLVKSLGAAGLFGACAAVMVLWLLVARRVKAIPGTDRKAA